MWEALNDGFRIVWDVRLLNWHLCNRRHDARTSDAMRLSQLISELATASLYVPFDC